MTVYETACIVNALKSLRFFGTCLISVRIKDLNLSPEGSEQTKQKSLENTCNMELCPGSVPYRYTNLFTGTVLMSKKNNLRTQIMQLSQKYLARAAEITNICCIGLLT